MALIKQMAKVECEWRTNKLLDVCVPFVYSIYSVYFIYADRLTAFSTVIHV